MSNNSTTSKSYIISIECCRFQRPSVTPKLDYKVRELLQMPSAYCMRSWRAISLRQLFLVGLTKRL